MNKFQLSIGDWSEDGHNICEFFFYQSNYSIVEMQEAYKNSCKLTGIQFHDGTDYTGLKDEKNYHQRLICVDYEDSYFTELVKQQLTKYSLEIKDPIEPHYFADLIMKFIALSMPTDFVFEEASTTRTEQEGIKALNGWWDQNLNEQFGYGLFD